jgi:hypothetical protein
VAVAELLVEVVEVAVAELLVAVTAAAVVAVVVVLRAEPAVSQVLRCAPSDRADREPRRFIVASRPALEPNLRVRERTESSVRQDSTIELMERARWSMNDRQIRGGVRFTPVERCSHEASDHDDPPRRVGRVLDPRRAGCRCLG